MTASVVQETCLQYNHHPVRQEEDQVEVAASSLEEVQGEDHTVAWGV